MAEIKDLIVNIVGIEGSIESLSEQLNKISRKIDEAKHTRKLLKQELNQALMEAGYKTGDYAYIRINGTTYKVNVPIERYQVDEYIDSYLTLHKLDVKEL